MNADRTAEPQPAGTDWLLDHIQADARRFAAAVVDGPLDAPIAACPGWDLRQLTAHMGVIQRWATHCAAHRQPPESRDAFQPDPHADAGQLAEWLLAGTASLVATLRSIDPESPTWHPFAGEQLAKVWPRRQAHELSVHRWDAERAVGPASPIDPGLASDGIDEHLDLMMRRLVERGVVTPAGSLHLHCTDTHGEWLVAIDSGDYRLERAHAKGDAALRGPAEALLLRLWRRSSDRFGELSPVGDATALASWLGDVPS